MVGNVPLQKRRALALSILMIALAQTSYIGALQGWTFVERLHDDDANYSNNCASASLGVGDPFHVDILNGSDLWAGTSNCPKSSILSAVENASSDDEIIVHAGRYHENITIDNKDGLIVRAATGERVVLDGTQSISQDFDATWTTPDSDGIQEVTLPVDGWQLFLDWEEQVPARWPNAGFANDSVFNRSYWAGGTLTGTNNAYTNGWLQDAGPETGVHDGLNETINATGLDPVGAIAILNVGSFKSYSREITSWNASTGIFGYDTTPSWKEKHHAYFLEGKRELIDVDGEWWFNNTNNRLHYRPTTGENANNLDLRVKVQPFAITIENSDDVTIQGIDFFGTTIDVNECDGCSFTNSTLEYPSTSRRGQGIADESEDDRFVTHFYRSKNTFVDRISITNTDGAAIEFHGAGGQSYNNVVNNSYFYAIDWSASDQKGLMTTIYEGGRDMTFSNNTVHLTGASSVLSIGDSPTVLYNEVWDVGHLQTDGAVVQLMQGEVQGSEIAYNWIHDISKYGIRFDAPMNQISTGNNGSIHHNVIWNASGGIMAKGDYHNISNNTVFGERVDGKNNIIILHEQNTGNENSTTWNNAVDAIAAHRSNTIWDYPLEDSTHGMNWNGYMHQYANSLSLFDAHACAILENNSLTCWGNNGQGRLGLGNTTHQSTPQYVDVGTGRTVKSLSTGGGNAAHTCAILDNGSVSCWGTNGNGQLGLGNTTHQSTPQYVDIGNGRTAIQITSGSLHTCALLDNQSVSCWGSNAYRQLGINSSISYSSEPMHVDLGNNIRAVEIQSGHIHTCALLDNGSLMCWGYNHYGQMGLGNNTNTIDPAILIPLDPDREVTSFAVGKHHTCITYDNGSVICSGRNNNGQLGRGNTADTNAFIYVSNLQNMSIQSSLAGYQSCVLLINGTAQCWGANWWGQLGDGSATHRYSPASVILPPGRKAAYVTTGHSHTCARLDNGSTACWGHNGNGRLALGNETGQNQPVITLLSDLSTTSVEDMLVDPDNDDFRPKWGSHLHRLDAGAYDAADNNPWDAGIEWNYTSSSKPNIGCIDSVAFNYQSNAVFDDGSCQFIKKDVSGGTGHLHQPIVPITFTESLSNINTGTWTSGVTNSSSMAQSDLPNHGTDIAIWPNGDIAIVYNRFLTTYSNKVLGLSIRSSSSWTHTILENNSDTGYYPSVAIDDLGALHISYLDNTNETLKYATNMSGSWVFSTLDNAKYTSSSGSQTDLQIDSKGDIHIIYPVQVSSKRALNHTTNAGGSWASTTVTNTAKNSLWPSLALDGNDFVHISVFIASGDEDLVYITNSKGYWTNETVDTSNDFGKYSQIAVDSNDKIVIVYIKDDGNPDIKWARGTSGSFSKSAVKNNVRASWLSLGIDSNDDIHVTSHNTNNRALYHYTNASGSWVQSDAMGLSGKFAEMAIDDNDDIHISHADTFGYSDLKYATFQGTGKGVKIQPIFSISPDLPKGLNFNWKTGEISGSPSELSTNTTYTVWVNGSGRSDSTSVWINVEENMRSSVPGLTATVNSLISPITFDWYSSIWETRVTNVSTSPAGNDNHAGRHTDSAADSNGKTHIVSFDDSNDDLRYTTNAGGSWSSSIIVSTGDTGRHPSIVIDSNDLIHVVFVDNTNTRLMYINKSVSSSSWSSPYQIHGDAKNNPTGLDLDDDDTLYVSWRRGDAAYYKQCFVRTKLTNSTSWDNVPGLVNFYSSGSGGGNENHWVRNSCDVAVDSNKKIHIVVNDNDKDLRYITNADGSWDAEDVQGSSSSSVDTGRFVKLAIDSQDYVHITYAEKLSTSDPKVYYEKRNPSTGSWSTREELSWYADYPAIAIDSHDYVHIVRTSTSAGDKLVYESNYGGGSVEYISSIHTSGNDYLEPSIVVDNNDDIHVAAGYGSNKRLVSGTVIGTGNGIKDDPGSWRPVISTISSCEVSPSLPQGLSVNNQRCTLAGIPTEVASNQTYTVWANTSSGDSFSTNLWLRVVNLAPSISYNYNSFNLTNNNVMSPNAIPTNSGGPIPSRIIDVGSVGSYTTWGISNDTSIAMDSNGYMHISYTDSTNKTLLYATDKSGSWVTTTVDSEYGSGDQSSIGLDSNNNVHIVHFESDEYRLRYTTNMSGSWVSSRIVATGFLGFSPSIALDSDDNIHVSYMQADSAYRIKYATNSSGSWVDTTVSPTTTDCSLVSPNICHLAPNAFYTTTSIALDSNDKPHISYTCAGTVSNADLCFTTNASGSWSYQTLDSSGNTGFDNSLSIDSDNNLHISYYDATNGNLRYATNKSGSWVYSSIDRTGDVGHDTSLGIDSDNNVHISYYDKTNRDLKYATNSSGVWVNSTIDSNLDVGTGSSIFIESNDRVHISYQESVSSTDGNLRYVIVDNNNSNYGWSINSPLPEGLDFNENTGVISGTPTEVLSQTQYTIWANNSGGSSSTLINISIETDGPAISYSPSEYNLTIGTSMSSSAIPSNAGGQTPTHEIWNSSSNSAWLSSAIDSNDFSHVSFYNSGDLYYSTDKSGSWVTIVVNNGGTSNVGQYNSIAVDSNDKIHISYWNATQTSLMYSTNSGGSWEHSMIDNAGFVGEWTSIAIDSNDKVHISYYEKFGTSSNENLKYATNIGGSWTNYTLEENNRVGSQTSIAIDSNNGVHIAYYHESNKDLKYINNIAGTWVNSTIDSLGTVGGQPSIVVDVYDNVHISYRDVSNSQLKYASNETGSWLNQSINNSANVGQHSHLAIDSDGHLHISFRDLDGSDSDILYGTNRSGSWDFHRFSIGPWVHQGSSVAVDSNDNVILNYFQNQKILKTITYTDEGYLGWSITPDLPTGLNFNISTGEISGTPTVVSPKTNYTVTARNIGGNSTTNINITVIDIAPSITYAPNDDIVTTVNTTISSSLYAPSVTGGAVTSWEISPSTSGYFHFNQVSGRISGSSDTLLTRTMFTIWANNSGGSAVAYINFTVNDVISQGISISPVENTTVTNNTAMNSITFTSSGPGEIVTWELVGTLPSGLTFTSTNQTIWGTPTELMTTTPYTIWANNTGGSVSAMLNITVIDAISQGISISPVENTTVTNNSAMDSIKFTSSGPGEIVTWELEGELPTGLTFTSANQTIWGTPTELMTTTQYTIWANNTGGQVSAMLNITVIDAISQGITISPVENTIVTNNTPISSIIFISSGPGEIVTWELVGTLPNGLTFTSANQTIWGTPTELMTTTPYTIWANNTGGQVSAMLNITVNDVISQGITISPNENTTLTNNSAMNPITFTSSGPGEIVTWELVGTLPTGLTFTSANQTIWGTPTELKTTTPYTIWANNTGGPVSAMLNITVNDVISQGITISPVENTTVTNNTAMNSITFISSGPGEIVTWELEGELPTGLTFTSANQTIWGIPTELMTTTPYTIWANNTGGQVSAMLNITVIDAISQGITISPNENTTLTNNSAMNPITFTSSGPGEIVTWELEGELPTGLTFTSANQTIWGTPTELMSTTPYTIWANNTGGPVSATLNITVNDVISQGITISPVENTIVTNNTAFPSITFSSSGVGEILTWELVGTLPTGLTFTSTNQTIWGMPTELMTTTPYTIWANNTGGQVSAMLNITVIDAISQGITVSPNENTTTTNNTPISPIIFTSSGPGEIVTWELEGELPTGLTFTSANQTIWGTPTELMTTTQYTIWANNTGGPVSAMLNITVNDQIPSSLTISPQNTIATNNTEISTIVISQNGPGEIVTWELVGTLPSGLTFTSTNQTIWGTPTELMTTTPYTIWANNTGGSVSAMLNITVIDEVPTTLSYSNPDILLTNNTAMTPHDPITTGPGTVVTWDIVGELPEGITFDSTTGVLSGTPTELMTTTQYTIWANNTGGSISTVINITVVDQLPSLTYPLISLDLVVNTINSDIPFEPALSGPGEIISWEMVGQLPSGMQFNPSTGILSGIPTELWSTANYTIWANNTGGSVDFSFSLTVVDQVPNEIGYSDVNLTLTNNTAMSPEQPLITGPGTITSWVIIGELPEGISFNESTGEISGTPTELWPITPYTVWANNSGGSVFVEFNISVIAIEPSISYNSNALTLTVGVSMTPLESLSTGGVIASWETYPELPDGISIDSLTGYISGTPTTLQSPQSYTIWANNSGGITTFELSISIIDIPASIDISPTSIALTIGESMNPAQISASGGQVIEWGIHPELPNGLLFDTTNLSITGMPSELIPETLYTIWANNSGGSQTASISITVIDIPPTIEYVDEHVFYSNVSEVLIEPIVNGGAILNYSIDSDLVNGLSFDYSNGSIVGIPSETLSRTQFTITVSNSGGTAVATLNITILSSVGCMDILAENYDPLAIQDSGLCIYTDSDGDGVADINEIEGCTDLDAVNYMPTATDDDGSCIPRLSVIYPEYSIILIVGQNNVSIVPEVLGQTVEIWSIEPSLPEPLEFNYLVENGVLTVGKGSISGIPLQPQNLSNYTIIAIDEDTNQSLSIRIYLQILEDTDGDGKPNVGSGNWVEDLDDDDDGYVDSIEEECGSDPENAASTPDLDSEGKCVQEQVSDTEEPPIPESTANLYYWCILPLAIILAVMFFSLISRQRHEEEENKESELDEYNQPLELT